MAKIMAVLLVAASLTAACVARWNVGNPAFVVTGLAPSAIAFAALPASVVDGSTSPREREGDPALAEVAGAVEMGTLLLLEPLLLQGASSLQDIDGVIEAAADSAPAEPIAADLVGARSPGVASSPAELVLAQAPVVTSPPVAGAEAAMASSSIRMPVPFRTQKDGDRFQGSNCGPAALGMVLDAFGVARGNADLRFLMHTYQGTVGARTGTALQHVAHVAADLGLEPRGLYQRPDGSWGKEGFAGWTVEDIRAEVLAGRPVVPLVKFRLLPGHEDSPFRADHYVVIHGVDGDSFLYHDPIYESPWEGGARWMSAETLATAMRPTLVPQQAVSFGSGRFAALPTVSR